MRGGDTDRLVGRRPELAALRTAVANLGPPGTRFVVVSGEPGIGKTRLLQELADRGGDAGHLVLTGHATELERDVPFGVWIDALDDHVAWLGADRLARMLGDDLAELSRVLPSAGRATPVPVASPAERYVRSRHGVWPTVELPVHAGRFR